MSNKEEIKFTNREVDLKNLKNMNMVDILVTIITSLGITGVVGFSIFNNYYEINSIFKTIAVLSVYLVLFFTAFCQDYMRIKRTKNILKSIEEGKEDINTMDLQYYNILMKESRYLNQSEKTCVGEKNENLVVKMGKNFESLVRWKTMMPFIFILFGTHIFPKGTVISVIGAVAIIDGIWKLVEQKWDYNTAVFRNTSFISIVASSEDELLDRIEQDVENIMFQIVKLYIALFFVLSIIWGSDVIFYSIFAGVFMYGTVKEIFTGYYRSYYVRECCEKSC